MSLLIEPVYLSSVIVGSGCPYSEGALQRAVRDRGSNDETHLNRGVPLVLMRSTIEFEHAKHCVATTSKPCPSCVVWWANDKNNNNG